MDTIEKSESVNKFLLILSEAPDGQLDKRIADDLKELIDKSLPEIKIGIMKAIDYCVYGGLASNFILLTLHTIFEQLLDGKTADFNDENCPWRKDLN
jgi:hypothetical protein